MLSRVPGSQAAIPAWATHWPCESLFPAGEDAGFDVAGGITALTAAPLPAALTP